MTYSRAGQRRRRAGRRRSRPGYGVTAPGCYATVPAWWGRKRWLSELGADLHSDDVRQLRAAVGTRGPVSVQAILAVATAISAAADGDTGRNAMPGNVTLTAPPATTGAVSVSSGYGLSTVQKAVQVLTARGWLVLVRAGKNRLRLDERREVWRSGSKARRRRNVWACTRPRHLPRSGCDLPTTRRVGWRSPVPLDKNITKPARATKPRRPPSRYRADERVVRLADDLAQRIPWLRRVPTRRILPPLHRFATSGWTARDLQAHLDRQLARRGWSVPGAPAETTRDRAGTVRHRPASTMRSPWGYLAFVLRHLDPSDLATEHRRAAEQAARDEWQRQLIHGPPCPHGQPAGDLPSPTRGVLACPFCRHEQRHA